MIFGDREEFALEADRFSPSWDGPGSDDESVWAAVCVWIAGANVTEHSRHGTDRLRSSLHIPLVPLARWCVAARAALHYEERYQLGYHYAPHDELEAWSRARPPAGVDEDAWLDRRDDWWSHHFTGAATPDIVAPSLGLIRQDDRALISWRAPLLPRPDRSFVSPQGAETVSWQVVSAAIDEFVASVRAWAPSETSFEVVAANRSALEYYTGIPDEKLAAFPFLPQATDDPAADPLAQVVRDLTSRTSMGPAQPSIINVVRDAGQPLGHDWWAVRQALIAGDSRHLEQEGYDGAQSVRGLLDLDGQPIDDVDRLLETLDVSIAEESPNATADRMIVAGTASASATTMVLASPRTEAPWGRRFELARALGHLVLDPLRGDAIGAASGPQAMASRRRRSGAFAAEFLLPTEAVAEASEGSLDGIAEGTRFRDLLHRFGVGSTTAAFHLWNQGFLSSPEVRDDLIASS